MDHSLHTQRCAMLTKKKNKSSNYEMKSFVRYALLFQSTLTIGSASNQFCWNGSWKLMNSAVISFIYSVCGYHPFRLRNFRPESHRSASAPAADRQWWLITQHCFLLQMLPAHLCRPPMQTITLKCFDSILTFACCVFKLVHCSSFSSVEPNDWT